MPAIFISYRKKDSGGHVGHLRSDLERLYGRKAVFTDFDSLEPGQEWMEEIEKALAASDIALVVIGEGWLTSEQESADGRMIRRLEIEEDPLRKEIAAALRHPRMKVVPILVEEAQPPAVAELPEDIAKLSGIHVCRLRNDSWDADFAEIRRLVEADADDSSMRRYVAKARVGIGRHRFGFSIGIAALAAVAAIALAFNGPTDEGCDNLNLPEEKRDKLSVAAGTSDPAEEGVLFGSCDGQDWAIAEFPDLSPTVFVEQGFHWQKLGPEAAFKCDEVPHELLDEWSVNDC
jgi:TIR domain